MKRIVRGAISIYEVLDITCSFSRKTHEQIHQRTPKEMRRKESQSFLSGGGFFSPRRHHTSFRERSEDTCVKWTSKDHKCTYFFKSVTEYSDLVLIQRVFLNLPFLVWSHPLHCCCSLYSFSTSFDLIPFAPAAPMQHRCNIFVSAVSWMITGVYNPVCCRPFRESHAWLISCTAKTVDCLLYWCCFCLVWLSATKVTKLLVSCMSPQ